jgi:serine/threonine protein kinase
VRNASDSSMNAFQQAVFLFETGDFPPAGDAIEIVAQRTLDPDVRRELHRLIRGFQSRRPDPDQIVNAAAAQMATDLSILAHEMVSMVVGGYRVLEVVGQGGTGIVFRVFDERHGRQGAMKVFDASPVGVLQRQAEMLAILRCEGARDAIRIWSHGEVNTSIGCCPYLVEDFVAEPDLLTFANDLNSLSIEERITLFCRVCDAVKWSHAKEISHYDLKPQHIRIANTTILDAYARLIDFGLSRVPGVKSTFGYTLAYASPEQIRPPHIADKQADVHALGVVLWQLITRCDPPPVPKDWLADPTSVTLPLSPRNLNPIRDVAPGVEHPFLSELDEIIACAVAANVNDRYSSVGDLQADLERLLRHLPISKKSRSPSYVREKFRHREPIQYRLGKRLQIALVVVVVLSALVTLILIDYQASRLAVAREREQVARERELAALEREQASADRLRSNQKNTSNLRNVVASSHLSRFASSDAARQYVEAVEKQAIADSSSERDLAGVYWMTGVARVEVGDYEAGIENLRKAVLIFRRELEPGALETLYVEGELVGALQLAGQPDEAIAAGVGIVNRMRAGLGASDPHVLDCEISLAAAHMDVRDTQIASEMLDRIESRVAEQADPMLTNHVRLLRASSLELTGRIDEAEREIRAVVGEIGGGQLVVHPTVLRAHSNLGSVLLQRARALSATDVVQSMALAQEGVGHLESSYAGRARILGVNHPHTIVTAANLAIGLTDLTVLVARLKPAGDDAKKRMGELLARAEQVCEPYLEESADRKHSQDLVTILAMKAQVSVWRNEFPTAEAIARRALDMEEALPDSRRLNTRPAKRVYEFVQASMHSRKP